MLPSAKTLSRPGAEVIARPARTDRDRSRTAVAVVIAVAALCFGGAAWAFSSMAPEPYMVSLESARDKLLAAAEGAHAAVGKGLGCGVLLWS